MDISEERSRKLTILALILIKFGELIEHTNFKWGVLLLAINLYYQCSWYIQGLHYVLPVSVVHGSFRSVSLFNWSKSISKDKFAFLLHQHHQHHQR